MSQWANHLFLQFSIWLFELTDFSISQINDNFEALNLLRQSIDCLQFHVYDLTFAANNWRLRSRCRSLLSILQISLWQLLFRLLHSHYQRRLLTATIFCMPMCHLFQFLIRYCFSPCTGSPLSSRGGFNGRPLVQWPTGPQASDVMGAPGIG